MDVRVTAAALFASAWALSYSVPTAASRAALASRSHQQVLSVYSDLVVLPVRVEHDAKAVTGLTVANFEVFEDGVPQTVSLFGDQDEPVTAGLVIDNSSSMSGNRERVIEAGLHFARIVNPRDELFVVHFNEHLTFGLPGETAFVSDRDAIRDALLRMGARGKTALYDAILAALEHLEKGTRQRRVLILVSDGGDNASERTFTDVLERARRSDAMIFSIVAIDEYASDTNPQVLKKLAAATGGDVWMPRRDRDVRQAFEQIADDIRTGYTIGYVSTNAQRDGTYRLTRVVARDAQGRKLSVRTRAGYIAAVGRSSK